MGICHFNRMSGITELRPTKYLRDYNYQRDWQVYDELNSLLYSSVFGYSSILEVYLKYATFRQFVLNTACNPQDGSRGSTLVVYMKYSLQ